MYKYLTGVALCCLIAQADMNMQKGIYDAAEEMIRFDKKMSQAIEEHNQIEIEEEREKGTAVDAFTETKDGYLFMQQIEGGESVVIAVSVKDGMLFVVTSTKEEKRMYENFQKNNIGGFEMIMNASSISISIPNNADETKMQKSYHDGLLKITFPKKVKLKIK